MRIRRYRESDIDQIIRLFYDSVHSVAAADYTKKQLNAWANDKIDKHKWNISLSEHYSVIAEITDKDGESLEIIGFGDIAGGYLDRLYVHKDYQRMGVASAIADELEEHALMNGETEITAHVSITARHFFVKRGYTVIREQHVERDGQKLANFVMIKTLQHTVR